MIARRISRRTGRKTRRNMARSRRVAFHSLYHVEPNSSRRCGLGSAFRTPRMLRNRSFRFVVPGRSWIITEDHFNDRGLLMRFISPSFLLVTLFMAFLPWVEVRCDQAGLTPFRLF